MLIKYIKEVDVESPSAFLLVSFYLLSSINLDLVLSLVFLFILILSSALISGSEIAYFSLLPDQLNELKHESSASSTKILNLRTKPSKLLATILISNNFVNIALVLLADFLIKQTLGVEILNSWGAKLKEISIFNSFEITTIAEAINFTIAVIGVTTILVLFGEVMPKIYANMNNLKLARFMSTPLSFLMIIFSPLSSILVKWTNSFETRLKQKNKSTSNTDKNEIGDALDVTLNSDEQGIDILKSIIKFSDVAVKQIMKPRNDVIAIDEKLNYKEILKIVRNSGYSRIPIYNEDFDDLTGILYAKDLISHLDKGDNFNWQSLIRKNIYYIPESKKINELLKDFQRLKLHIGIIVDEYGGSAGIVTMEDIMEEILGEIFDEFDEEQVAEFQLLKENVYIFEGKTMLIDFVKTFDEDVSIFDDIKGEADSMAGLILEIAGELPKKGYDVKMNKFTFIVEGVTKRRIHKIKVIVNEVEDEYIQ